MYSNKFVMCVLVDGEVQKELANGVVNIPFDCEYALRFRNKNDRRAVVKIFIDGENVSNDGYIVPANGHVDIKRHSDKDRSFKFVSLDSAEAVDFGKNGPNPDKVKGTIEARFYLEKKNSIPIQSPVVHHHHYHPPVVYPPIVYPPNYPIYRGNNAEREREIWCDCDHGSNQTTSSDSTFGFIRTCSVGSDGSRSNVRKRSIKKDLNLDGCTVEGNTTGQSFRTVSIELEETYTSLKIFLQGYENLECVEVPHPESKNKKLSDLEKENEELRLKLAEIENEKLKEKLKNS